MGKWIGLILDIRGRNGISQIVGLVVNRNSKRTGVDGANGEFIVVAVTVTVPVIVLVVDTRDGSEDLDFAAQNKGEAIAADGLLNTREIGTVSPFVELAAEGVGLEFEKSKLARSEKAVTARGVDVRDGGVDNRGL